MIGRSRWLAIRLTYVLQIPNLSIDLQSANVLYNQAGEVEQMLTTSIAAITNDAFLLMFTENNLHKTD